MNEFVLMTYYVKYLKEIRKVSDSSVKHYQDALRYTSKYLVQSESWKLFDHTFIRMRILLL